MSSGDGLFYLVAGFCAGIFFFVVGLKSFMRKRLIENIPTSKVRSVAMGLAEIYGEVVPSEGRILKSPFTDRECVYYKYKIEQWRQGNKGRGHWATVRHGERGEHFFIKDETGFMLVDPAGANVDIKTDTMMTSGSMGNPNDSVKAFLDSVNFDYKGLIFNKSLRYTEYFISPGDKCYIMGTAGDNPFIEEATAKRGTEDVMMQKGDSVYYISDRPEKEILTSLRRKAILGTIGGPLLSGGCLALLFIYFHLT
jgi:hypothetical protein